jgi:BirA family transcriptional regulator, biotin operon repressor / biotin---[acetyl-CoA-carboxylase] ligase
MKTRDFNIIELPETDSTNNYATKVLKGSRPAEMTVVYTDYQNAGKGQPGNAWQSEREENLLFSIIFYPKFLPAERQFYLSKVVSLGICDALSAYLGEGLYIKWPNDIFYKNWKIGGILIENSLMADKIDYSVIGIGININQTIFPEELPNPVSLMMITKKGHERKKVLNDILNAIDNRYHQLRNHAYRKINDDYFTSLYKAQQHVQFNTPDTLFRARVSGVNETGELLLQLENNEIRSFRFKEIEFMI